MFAETAASAARVWCRGLLVAAVVLVGTSVSADVVEDASNAKSVFTHRNAKITDVSEGKLVFRGDNGTERRVDLAAVKRIEVSDNREKALLNAAEIAYSEDKGADAVKAYEGCVRNAGTNARWRNIVVRGRLIALYAKQGNPDKLVLHLVELNTLSPKDAMALLPTELPGSNDEATKRLEAAISAGLQAKRDVAALVQLRKKFGGSDTPEPMTKTDPATKTGPVTKSTGSTTSSGAVSAFNEVGVHFDVTSPAHIGEVVKAFDGGKGRPAAAAELFLRASLAPETNEADAERYLLNGGMACVLAGKEIDDKLQVTPADKKEERAKLTQERDRLLMSGAIALTDVLQLPGAETKPALAEAAFWCGWAHEKLSRPVRAREVYSFFLQHYAGGAKAELTAKVRSAQERLSSSGN